MFALTSDGNPYARFRRALATGNETLVVAAARELPQVSLDDALRICLVLRGGDPARYERAAVRWLGRFALEGRRVTIADLRQAAERARRVAGARRRGDGATATAVPGPGRGVTERLQRLCLARARRDSSHLQRLCLARGPGDRVDCNHYAWPGARG